MKTMLFVLFIIIAVYPKTIQIKMASIAPENSPWGETFNKIAAQWSEISKGTVKLKIYHNGIVGSEGNMIRKMKIGQIQAGAFSSYGLTKITPEIMSLSIPFLIKTDEELNYVLEKINPMLESQMQSNDFVSLGFSKAGWIRFFTKGKAITDPDDLMSLKIACNPDEQALYGLWKNMKYHLIPVSFADILQYLNNGLINAIFVSPIAAGSMQWFGIANNMTDLTIAPFLGGILVNKKQWDRIPDELKGELKNVVTENIKQLDKDIIELEKTAIETMVSYGLKVHPVSDELNKKWTGVFDSNLGLNVEELSKNELYSSVKLYLKEYHEKNK